MQEQAVFNCEKERKRLQIQNALLRPYETPALCFALKGVEGATVLDVGCNDGSKTRNLFSGEKISKVIGLEYNHDLALAAQEKHGDRKFSFYQADVEGEDFLQQLRVVMTENGIEAFDLIYLSFVLMHLRQPEAFLRKLSSLLSDRGVLMIVEADDSLSSLEPDVDGMLPAFLKILEQDPFAGNRGLGATLAEKLHHCGYEDVRCWCDRISAIEQEKKRAVFETFFSYLPEDVAILRQEQPSHELYRMWQCWLERHYDKLRSLIVEEASEISMGMKIVSCKRGNQ